MQVFSTYSSTDSSSDYGIGFDNAAADVISHGTAYTAAYTIADDAGVHVRANGSLGQ